MEIKFEKVHTTKDLIISAIVLAAGIGLFFINTGLGVIFAACGILMLLFYKSGYICEGDNTVLEKKALDIAHSCKDSLKAFLEGKDVEPEVKTNINGGIIRLEVFYNATASIAYAQLFDFSNYNYEPATEIVELRGERAEKLINKLKSIA
ncbi:MAG: hypothetical protein IKH00_06815 [Bacteroidales bacterium]|nr:hypothetical protein [Bacteroidales bacterium]